MALKFVSWRGMQVGSCAALVYEFQCHVVPTGETHGLFFSSYSDIEPCGKTAEYDDKIQKYELLAKTH